MIKQILDVPQPHDCKNCKPCLRLRMMEMGFISGQNIEITSHKLGLWIVNILSENNDTLSTIALRDEEFERICFV